MSEKQEIIEIREEELLARIKEHAENGFRLVQIGCSKLGDFFQLDYSFDKDYRFVNLRLGLPVGNAKIPSISAIYGHAFTYENEIHDLFGVEVTDINLDYHGKFYRTAIKTPFNPAPAGQSQPGAIEHG